eukprot:c19149_g2_i1 orf=133-969(+)
MQMALPIFAPHAASELRLSSHPRAICPPLSPFLRRFSLQYRDYRTTVNVHFCWRDRQSILRSHMVQHQTNWRKTPVQKKKHVVRNATTEDVEAEKGLIEYDAIERMEKTLETVKTNFNTIRTGRASPALLDRVEVEYYGTLVILKSISQVSASDGSTLLIQPFDTSSLGAIEKAITKSNLGLTPNNDGSVIRLSIPQLTEERRKDLLKETGKLAEEGKIAIRNVRRDAIKSYEKLEKEKKLSEDNLKALSTSMQRITDDYVKQIDSLFKQKEKELTAV